MPPARPEPTEARGCPRRLNGKDTGEGSGEGAPRTRSAVRPRSCSALAKSQKPPRDARAVQRREGCRWEEAPAGPGRPPRSHPTGTGQGTTGRRRRARQSFAKRPPKRPWARDGFRRRHSRHLERHDLGGGIPAVVASPWWHPHDGTPGGGIPAVAPTRWHPRRWHPALPGAVGAADGAGEGPAPTPRACRHLRCRSPIARPLRLPPVLHPSPAPALGSGVIFPRH